MRNRFDAWSMSCVGLMPLVATLATFGCGGPSPIEPQGFDTLDELKTTITDAFSAGDYDRMWASIYPEGNELSKDRGYRKDVEAIYDWGRSLGLSLRCVRVLDAKEFPIPPESMQIDGRPIETNFPPSHLLSIHFWEPPSERDPDGFGSATFHLDVGVGQVDGKWWCVGMKYADTKKQSSQPVEEVSEPLPPLGKELSEVVGVSLKRHEEPQVGDSYRALFMTSQDYTQMKRSPKGANLLGDLLLDVMPFDHWTKDFHLLPDGYYSLEVDDLPKSREECFELVREAFEGAFDLRIEPGETNWDAFRITVPEELPQDVWADPNAKWNMQGGAAGRGGAIDGYKFAGINFAEFEEWLGEHLEAPVTIVNPPEGKFSMDILISGVDEPKLLEVWLKEGGFKVERYQTPVPTVTVHRATAAEEGK